MQEFVYKLRFGCEFLTENGEKKKFATIYFYCSSRGYNENWSLPCQIELSATKNSINNNNNNYNINNANININNNNNNQALSAVMNFIFDKKRKNRGWPRFTKWENLLDPNLGYDAVNDSVCLKLTVTN